MRLTGLSVLVIVAACILVGGVWSCGDGGVIVDKSPGDEKVQGTVTISVTVTGDKAAEKVEIYVDDALETTLTESPYEYKWDTTKAANGTHTIKAKAYFADGGTKDSNEITADVAN